MGDRRGRRPYFFLCDLLRALCVLRAVIPSAARDFLFSFFSFLFSLCLCAPASAFSVVSLSRFFCQSLSPFVVPKSHFAAHLRLRTLDLNHEKQKTQRRTPLETAR